MQNCNSFSILTDFSGHPKSGYNCSPRRRVVLESYYYDYNHYWPVFMKINEHAFEKALLPSKFQIPKEMALIYLMRINSDHSDHFDQNEDQICALRCSYLTFTAIFPHRVSAPQFGTTRQLTASLNDSSNSHP